MTDKKVEIYNKGKREYTIPPAKEGGKNRMIMPGRKITLEKAMAQKMIDAYPNDIIEFGSLETPGGNDISKENKRLEDENAKLKEYVEKGEVAFWELAEETEKLKAKLAESEKPPKKKG